VTAAPAQASVVQRVGATAVTRDVFVVCNTIHEVGGVQRWAHRMGELLAARGHRVRLIGVFAVRDPQDPAAGSGEPAPYATSVLHPDKFGAKPRPALLSRIGNPTAALRYRRWRSEQRAGAARLAALLKTAADPASAVVICAQVHAMEWVELAAPEQGPTAPPVIAMSHESYEAAQASSRGRRVRQHYAGAARFLSLTQIDADRWIREGGMNNADAIPNPLPLPADGGADPAAQVVVSAGRLSQEKGFDLLVEAWALALADPAHDRSGWTLRIHGEGPERAALTAQAASLGVSGSVELAGQTTEIGAALKQGSVFASGSRAEGFPMALLEAMACGLPCVAFDCAPGVRELIHDGSNGALVSPGNVHALAERLGALMDSRESRGQQGRAATESVAAYAPGRIVERWEAMFALVHR
jgi:glycosyltransferase involved in cell wall biosynthesis